METLDNSKSEPFFVHIVCTLYGCIFEEQVFL